jgi:hypothetical protein
MRTMPPVGQRDLDDLCGDPFLPAGTNLHDRPPRERHDALQSAMDWGIERQVQAVTERLGDEYPMAKENYRAATEQDIRNKVVVGGQVIDGGSLEQMLTADGHHMPTTAQGYIDGLSNSDFQADDAKRALAADVTSGLWDDYQTHYGSDDPQGVAAAAQAGVNELRERGVSDIDRYIRRNRSTFLEAVNYWARNITATPDDGSGRTAGFETGSGSYTPAPAQDDADTVDIIHEMQRQRGW